ncbi:MAG: hypothetical protein ACP5HK_02155 [Acidilobus sp.]
MAGVRRVARRILWLRGDPEGIRELKRRLPLLRPQGIHITFDPSSRWDVAVAPVPGSPEAKTVRESAEGPAIFDPDPLRSLMLALAFPRGAFSTLKVGVDPGLRSCGVGAVADGLVVEAESLPCDLVVSVVERLVRLVPACRYDVVLGSGSGWENLASGLARVGIAFRVADEMGTTGAGEILPVRIKDRNARAAVALALRADVNNIKR